MEPSRAAAVQDVCLLADSVRHLTAQLQRYESICEQMLRKLAGEWPVSDILQSVEASDARGALNSALEDLERVRHRSRLSIIAAEIEEGSSVTEVGRQWGFSRQMAQRYVKEARTGSWTATHGMVPSDVDHSWLPRVEDVETERVHRRPDGRSMGETSGSEIGDRDQSGHPVG
jgi:hypothetical protein